MHRPRRGLPNGAAFQDEDYKQAFSPAPARAAGSSESLQRTVLIIICCVLFATLMILVNKPPASAGPATIILPPQPANVEFNPQAFAAAYPAYEAPNESAALTDEEADTLAEAVQSSAGKQQPVQQEEKGTDARFLDQAEYDAAPYIVVPFPKIMRQPVWWALKPYESYGKLHPLKQYVPRLNPKIQLTPEMFHEQFRRHGQPVIINSESLRHLGYRTRAWTFDEMVRVFPFDESAAPDSKVVKDYKANSRRQSDDEIDLGPGLASILRDEKLAKQGALRNYPRNLHVKKEALGRLEVDTPPLIAGGESTWQLPTLWLGTTTADTPFHHDCCDNFVVMLAGVKRFTLAPPTDWRTLSPVCTGPNKSLCWAKVSDPAKQEMSKKDSELMRSVHKITIELQPGEIMYMPAGWFHHIKNLGPTVMVNHWTTSSQQVGLVKVLKETS